MFSKENKQIEIPGIYGRLRGHKGSSCHYRSSNLSKSKEERATLAISLHTHAITFKSEFKHIQIECSGTWHSNIFKQREKQRQTKRIQKQRKKNNDLIGNRETIMSQDSRIKRK